VTLWEKGLMKLFKIALFLLSISTHAALAGEIKPYSQAEFNKPASEGKPILLDFRADWCATCAAQEPVIRELMAQSKYKDLTRFIIDFDTDTALSCGLRSSYGAIQRWRCSTDRDPWLYPTLSDDERSKKTPPGGKSW
jgi:thiol-disulfide isomerase/thioredoxin